jgi:hypothetical protein
MLIKYDNVFPFSMKDLGRCKHVVLYKPYKWDTHLSKEA